MPGAGAEAGPFRIRVWMRSPLLHEWIKTIGILVATSWGVYTFWWKEIFVPAQAPASITLKISLSPIVGGEQRVRSPPWLKRELMVSATNESNRRLYLLSSFWELFPIRRLEQSSVTFFERAKGPFEPLHVEREAVIQPYPTVAAGKLFVDDHINPGETISRSLVVTIPSEYDVAQVDVVVPVLTRKPPKSLLGGRILEWGYNQSEEVIPLLCTEDYTPDCSRLDSDEKQETQLVRKLKAFDPRYFLNEKSVQMGLSSGT